MCERNDTERRRKRMGYPVKNERVSSQIWGRGMERKKGRKHVEWWTEKMDEGMLFVPKLLSSKDSLLMPPPSLLFTPIFSPALLWLSFSIFYPPPLSVSLRLAFFSFLSLCELQQKADGAVLTSEWAAPTFPWRERRRWRSREEEAEESTP